MWPVTLLMMSASGKHFFNSARTSSLFASSQSKVMWYPLPKRPLRNKGVPRARNRPPAKMPIRSPKQSASSIEWVVRQTIRSVFSFEIDAQVRMRESGSKPVVGSSKKTMDGAATDAMATERRRFMPPLYDVAATDALSSRPTPSSNLSASSRNADLVIPLKRPQNLKWERPEMPSKSTLSCGQTPMIAWICAMADLTDMPCTKASPCVGGCRPVKMLIVVVFPAPLCPRRQKTSPRFMTTVSSFNAVV
mmetsp:Transcript_41749/g.110115  ORF Transcript_41749/g.110115 Transcript_41749/m.110115 type:complete len:249 (-) Transcript_41749:495-1241(-)